MAAESVQRSEGERAVTVAYLDGELGLAELDEVGQELFRLMHERRTRVVLDLSGVPHVDYRGMGALVSRAELFRRAGGDLKLSGLSPYLDAIVRVAGGHGKLERYATAQDARDAFERRRPYVA